MDDAFHTDSCTVPLPLNKIAKMQWLEEKCKCWMFIKNYQKLILILHCIACEPVYFTLIWPQCKSLLLLFFSLQFNQHTLNDLTYKCTPQERFNHNAFSMYVLTELQKTKKKVFTFRRKKKKKINKTDSICVLWCSHNIYTIVFIKPSECCC